MRRPHRRVTACDAPAMCAESKELFGTTPWYNCTTECYNAALGRFWGFTQVRARAIEHFFVAADMLHPTPINC